jgi:hypothetical protein
VRRRRGTVRHDPGSPAIGFPAINVFDCSDGRLRIGFGPGPDQMDNAVQTSDGEVLDGTDRYDGAHGDGEMSVESESVGSTQGRETSTGEAALP